MTVTTNAATTDAAGPRAAPSPIPLPSRAAVEEASRLRAAADNARFDRQRKHIDTLIKSAADDAFDQGERTGYTQGWHWGVVCGIVAGALATMAAQMLYEAAARWLA